MREREGEDDVKASSKNWFLFVWHVTICNMYLSGISFETGEKW